MIPLDVMELTKRTAMDRGADVERMEFHMDAESAQAVADELGTDTIPDTVLGLPLVVSHDVPPGKVYLLSKVTEH